MTDTILVATGALCLLAGFVGCVVPIIPGVAFAYGALLVLIPTSYAISTKMLVLGGVIAVVAIVLDYVVPAIGAKKFNCSRWGVFGCLAGTIVGLFFMPFGILLGPFLGAVIGELVAGKKFAAAIRGGLGALLGFLLGVVMKLTVCSLFAWWFVRACSG